MKRMITLAALIIASQAAIAHEPKEPVLVRVSECDAYQIEVITLSKRGIDRDLDGYCSLEEAQNKFDALSAKSERKIPTPIGSIYQIVTPLFQR